MGRLGFTTLSSTSWKHEVPVTEPREAEGTTVSPSTPASQLAWKGQQWPEQQGLEQLCCSVPWWTVFLRAPVKFLPPDQNLAQSSLLSFKVGSAHPERKDPQCFPQQVVLTVDHTWMRKTPKQPVPGISVYPEAALRCTFASLCAQLLTLNIAGFFPFIKGHWYQCSLESAFVSWIINQKICSTLLQTKHIKD